LAFPLGTSLAAAGKVLTNPLRNTLAMLGLTSVAVTALAAWAHPPIDLAERAQGATQVVVATVVGVEPRFEINQFGDQEIVSSVQLKVHETLRGPHKPSVTLVIEGGTIGDLTLEVSDMPALTVGERAVFLLIDGPIGDESSRLHRRGLGALTLDGTERIRESGQSLDEVRRAVRGVR
jgi:hypothetical protein